MLPLIWRLGESKRNRYIFWWYPNRCRTTSAAFSVGSWYLSIGHVLHEPKIRKKKTVMKIGSFTETIWLVSATFNTKSHDKALRQSLLSTWSKPGREGVCSLRVSKDNKKTTTTSTHLTHRFNMNKVLIAPLGWVAIKANKPKQGSV